MSICMAHRGWSGKAPENTLAALKLAVEAPFVSAIEIDVQLSKDNVPVIIHDFVLNRTTNGSGLVRDFTLKELRELDAGSWFSPEFEGEKIPTLEEVLSIVKENKKKINIELKTAGNMYEGLEGKVIDAIHQLRIEDDAVITSFDHERIKEVNRQTSDIETGLIIWGRPSLVDQQLDHTGANILSMAFPYLTKDFVEYHINNGRKTIAWTPNSRDEIRDIKTLHSDIIVCTDFPEYY